MPRLHIVAASGNIEDVIKFLDEGDHINDMNETVTSSGVLAGSPEAKEGEDFGRKIYAT